MPAPTDINFPAALDTEASLFPARDQAYSTLTAPVGAADATLPMAATTAYPAAGYGTVNGEHVHWTGKTANSLTGVSRGLFQSLGGIAATSHASGSQVAILVAAASHWLQSRALIEVETKLGVGADTPAAGEFLVGTGPGSSGWRSLVAADVTTALGFTPTNRAGDTLTGVLAIDDGAGDPAGSGSIRLRNAAAVSARNAAGDGDVALVALDASGRVALRGGVVGSGGATLDAAGRFDATTLAATGQVIGASAVLGGTPAAAGIVRLPHNQWVAARNAAGSADVNLIRAGAGNAVEIGAAATVAGSLTATGAVGSTRSDAADAYLTADSPFTQEAMVFYYAAGLFRWGAGRPASSDNWRLTSGSYGTVIEAAYATGLVRLPNLAGSSRRLLSANAAGELVAAAVTTDGNNVFAPGTYNASGLAGSGTRLGTVNSFGDFGTAAGITTDGNALTLLGTLSPAAASADAHAPTWQQVKKIARLRMYGTEAYSASFAVGVTVATGEQLANVSAYNRVRVGVYRSDASAGSLYVWLQYWTGSAWSSVAFATVPARTAGAYLGSAAAIALPDADTRFRFIIENSGGSSVVASLMFFFAEFSVA